MSESERYTIKGKIGQGGVGAVYRAFDSSLQRDVAIKRLLSQDHKPEEERRTAELLVKEAGMLSKLQHPNIVTVYDVGIDDDGGYVVMELIDGETFDITISRGALTATDFALVVDQTLEAMTAAQEINLLHRDLKPSNVMVSWLPSGRFQVKVLDFGLAKLSQTPALQTVDHVDAIMGSIYFMAPEQFDREPLDARTDLYSLGCLYYYGLTGNYPFDGEEAPNVMIAHLEHEVTPLAEVRPDLPPAVCDWVMRLISKEPDDRPASASAALNEFEPVQAAISRAANPQVETTDVPPPPPPSPNRPQLITGPVAQLRAYPTQQSTGYQMQLRKEGFPVAAAVLWTLAAITIGFGGWLIVRERDEPNPPPQKKAPEPAPRAEVEPGPRVQVLPARADAKIGNSPQRFIFPTSRWYYFAGDAVDKNWFTAKFDDTSWKRGKAPLGFGDPVTTTIGSKGDARITYYFRKSLEVTNASGGVAEGTLVAQIKYDDGFRMYLNGVEILRRGFPTKKLITAKTFSSNRGKSEKEDEWEIFELDAGLLKDGKNVFAVEVHQTNITSSDLRFAMVLDYVEKGKTPPPPAG